MKKIVFFGILMGLIGMVGGYFLFARVAGEYVSINDLLDPPKNLLEEITETIVGVKEIRQNIFVSGGIGAGIGLLLGAILSKKRA